MVSSTYSNASDKGWIVQKFGGTSVGKFPDKACRYFPAAQRSYNATETTYTNLRHRLPAISSSMLGELPTISGSSLFWGHVVIES